MYVVYGFISWSCVNFDWILWLCNFAFVNMVTHKHTNTRTPTDHIPGCALADEWSTEGGPTTDDQTTDRACGRIHMVQYYMSKTSYSPCMHPIDFPSPRGNELESIQTTRNYTCMHETRSVKMIKSFFLFFWEKTIIKSCSILWWLAYGNGKWM